MIGAEGSKSPDSETERMTAGRVPSRLVRERFFWESAMTQRYKGPGYGGRGLAAAVALCCAFASGAAAQTTPVNPARTQVLPGSPTCLKANPFDTTSAESIIKRVTAAGYTNVRGLYKGCDGLWRGHALQKGIDVNIMVTPTGQVLKNGY
jgi:hypothetical protein